MQRKVMNDRKELFGQYPGSSERNSLLEKNKTFLEQENEERLGDLHSKMSSLRELAIDINTEVKTQNKYLDEMNQDMNKTQGLLGNTIGKIGELMKSGDGNYMCLLIVFIVIVFLVVWKLFK
ncbi:hypothetical protein WA158_001647 [Blastocystis sp. Blastoise]